MSDVQMPSFDIDDIAVEFYHVVVVVQVYVYLMDLTVKASELFNETCRCEDEEACTAHQHKRGHDNMHREKKYNCKNIFEYTVFEPAKTKCFREEDMLKVSHIPCGEEEKLIVHLEKMMFLRSGLLSPCKFLKYSVDLWCMVYLGDNIERTGRIENEGGHIVQSV